MVPGTCIPRWEVGASKDALSNWKGELKGPSPPEWLEWDAFKLKPSSGPGRRLSLSPRQLVYLVQAPTSMAGFPSTYPPREPLLEGKQRGWDTLVRNPKLRIYREPVTAGVSRRGTEN